MNENITKNIFYRTPTTRPFEGADAVSTDLEIDMSTLSQGDIQEIAIKSIVTSWQAAVRRAANAKENAKPIPTKDRIVVQKPEKRGHKPTLEEQVMSLTPEEKRELMEKLMAE